MDSDWSSVWEGLQQAGRPAHLQMLSMEMSLSCSYMEGWPFLLASTLRVEDWECSLVTLILISPVPADRGRGHSQWDSPCTCGTGEGGAGSPVLY